MISPPITGNDDLDSYLYNMKIAVEESSGSSSAVATEDTISVGSVLAKTYSERYIQIRYADDGAGTNFSTEQENRKYFGVYNSITEDISNNFEDYTWYEVSGGFGADKYLFYTVSAQREFKLVFGVIPPRDYWAECPSTAIDLDKVTETVSSNSVFSAFYPKQYIQVRYADDNIGTGITIAQANKKYFGIFNSITTTASENPADYTWYLVDGGFGTDRFLFYTVLRGRQLKLYVGVSAPTQFWAECPATYINIDTVSEGFIDNTDFFDGYEPVGLFNGLPDPLDYDGPNVVYDTVTNKLYRWQDGQWWSNVLAADIEGALAYENFSNSLRPVEIVEFLPTTGNFLGRVAVLMSDSKLYRYTETGWSAAVEAIDLTGQITGTQIQDGSISTPKLTALSITSDKIAANAVTAGKLSADSVTAGVIAAGAVTADKIAANSITAGKLNVATLSSITALIGTIQTAVSGNRIVINQGGNNAIQTYVGSNLVSHLGSDYNGGLLVNTVSVGALYPAIQAYSTGYNIPTIYGSNTQTTSSDNANGVSGYSLRGNAVAGTGVYAGTAAHGVTGANQGVGGTATRGLVGAANSYDFYADGAGTNYGPFTGAHDVLVPVDLNIEIGYICLDTQCILKKNLSNTVFEVEQSSAPNQIPVGVMVLNNGLLSNSKPAAFVEKIEYVEEGGRPISTTTMYPEYDLFKNMYNYCAVNAVGEGQVMVCGENGDIASGDLIVTSSVPGVGMKQSDDIVRNITVAKAREPIVFNDKTTPQLVACIYLCG